MGRRGPAPKTKRELEATGSYRHDRHGDRSDVDLPHKAPKPPSNLDREAAAEWKRIVKLLEPRRVLSEGDRAALTMTCELWSEDRKLGKQLDKLVSGSTDWKRVFTARQDVRKLLKDMLARFGLTPADRGRVANGESSTEKSNDANDFSKPNPPLRIAK